MGQLPKGTIDLIETNEDARSYVHKKNKKLSYITQTTLSVDDTIEIIKILKNKFPNIKEPKKDDICYATTNRQLAVKKIANKCEMFFVIGSRNSSNSQRLVEAAKKSGCLRSQLLYFLYFTLPFHLGSAAQCSDTDNKYELYCAIII